MTDADILDGLAEPEVLDSTDDGKSDVETVTESVKTSEWPKSVEEIPDGSLTVSEFEKHLNKVLVGEETQRLLDAGETDPISAVTKALKVQVGYQTVVQAVNAKRHPLPSYVVRSTIVSEGKDDDGNPIKVEKVQERTYIPVDIAMEAWRTRPTRGAGRVAEENDTNEGRLLRAGKVFAALEKAKARLARVTEQVESLTGKSDKHKGVLARHSLTEDAAIDAYNEWLSSKDAGKEITDDNESGDTE